VEGLEATETALMEKLRRQVVANGKADPATFSSAQMKTNHDETRKQAARPLGRKPQHKQSGAKWWWRDTIGKADPATFS